ncbi:MAG: hypothetical protein ACI9B9_001939 [Halioglobus sp.]|jgi:hypothetical protein
MEAITSTGTLLLFYLQTLLTVLAFSLVIIGITWVITYALRKIPKVGNVLSALFVLFIVFRIITAIWPRDSFYTDDFEYFTKLELPEVVEVLYKSSSFPDMHGDYFSKALFRVENLNIEDMPANIEESSECPIPTAVEAHIALNTQGVQCWFVDNLDGDKHFEFLYLPSIDILYFSFFKK